LGDPWLNQVIQVSHLQSARVNYYSDYQNNFPLIDALNEVWSRGVFLSAPDPQVINRNIFLIITINTIYRYKLE
jgi:hypothetical protein